MTNNSRSIARTTTQQRERAVTLNLNRHGYILQAILTPPWHQYGCFKV